MSKGTNDTADESLLEDIDSSDDEECLRLWLGGISRLDLSLSAWDVAADEFHYEDESMSVPFVETIPLLVQPPKLDVPIQKYVTSCQEDRGALYYSLAFTSVRTARGEENSSHPDVRVIDFSASGRGNALMATRRLAAGDVIFTEYAAVASQVPSPCEELEKSVRSCQCCFRSLEAASSCCMSKDSTSTLPFPDLWPIPEIEFDYSDIDVSSSIGKTRRDKHGRIQCQQCFSWFCSLQCRNTFEVQYGSCCSLVEMISRQKLHSRQRPSVDADDEEQQPAINLAVRMFATLLRNHRSQSSNQTSRLFEGLCGDAMNTSLLELGTAVVHPEHGSISSYSLDSVFEQLVQIWDLTAEERSLFGLECFSELTAKAARNGFGIKTQSPFKSYYSALLRSCSGMRGSKQHEDLKFKVALALGAENGNLERGMDQVVEALVCPEIVALFPLTARMNHSCGRAANAEVRSQEFVDCHIDVVALRDISCGEEITISYIYSGRKNYMRRRKELQGKYLFHCECQLCQDETSSTLSIQGSSPL